MNTRLNLFIVGFVSSSVQLLLLRELMNITGGYELISGAFFGAWLITSALGALAGGSTRTIDPVKLNLVFSLSPLLSVLILLLLSRFYFLPGQTPSFVESFIFTLLVLLPFSAVSGFTFIKLVRSAADMPGLSFSIETTGGILAGIFISIVTAGMLNTWQLIMLIILLSTSWAMLKFEQSENHIKLVIKILTLLFTVAILVFNIDIYFRQILLPGVVVGNTFDTPYGNLTMGSYQGEESKWYNHNLIFYEADAASREENIHYALLQCDDPASVILISGNLSSHLAELTKYPVRKVIYVERDPALASVPESVPENISLTVAETDGYRYIMNSHEKAGAMILLVPPPSTLQLNRYYTSEFFSEAKMRLVENGVFMCSPGAAELYYNEQSVSMYSSIYNSLKSAFKNVLPVSGNKLYFIASDKQLSASFSGLIQSKNIDNEYVNPDFIPDDLTIARSQELIELFSEGNKKNTISFPISYRGFQSNVLEKSGNAKTLSIVILVSLFALPVLFTGRRNIVMYSAASALAGFEIIILVLLQLTAGNMYQMTGLILAGLMSGLAAGAAYKKRFSGIIPVIKSIVLGIYLMLTAVLFEALLYIKNYIIIIIIILIISFIPAFITGNLFRQLTGADRSEASSTYSADLAGSAFGFVLISGAAIPLIGLRNSLFLLSAMVFAGAALGRVRAK